VDTLTVIDAVAQDGVLVVGSMPPLGRDLDLLMRPSDRSAVQLALRSHGFQALGGVWVRFESGRPEVVELLTPGDWALPEQAAEELFRQAVPLVGRSHLFRPAPTHRLLILARKLPRTPGLLSNKHRREVADVLRLLPGAFDEARPRARDWRVKRRLKSLQRRFQSPRRADRLLRWLHKPRRGMVIALSGLDGAGKSTQAQAVRAALATLGYDVVAVWTPLGSNLRLRRLASAGRRLLARLPAGPYARGGRDPTQSLLSSYGDDTSAQGTARKAAVAVWTTVNALTNAVSFRRPAGGTRFRGRIVIYDRYVLDTVVDLRFNFAGASSFRVQEKLVRLVAPTPRCAFLLDLPPETAHARKPDWSLAQTRMRAAIYGADHRRLGVRLVDAQRPPDELTAEITLAVLEARAG
jgi:thymidylate kinase